MAFPVHTYVAILHRAGPRIHAIELPRRRQSGQERPFDSVAVRPVATDGKPLRGIEQASFLERVVRKRIAPPVGPHEDRRPLRTADGFEKGVEQWLGDVL